MTTPSSDTAAMRSIIRALVSAGWTLHQVWDTAGIATAVTTETEALDAINAVDSASLVLTSGEATGVVFFVLGNAPFEVAADYTTNLSAVIEPLTDSWW